MLVLVRTKQLCCHPNAQTRPLAVVQEPCCKRWRPTTTLRSDIQAWLPETCWAACRRALRLLESFSRGNAGFQSARSEKGRSPVELKRDLHNQLEGHRSTLENLCFAQKRLYVAMTTSVSYLTESIAAMIHESALKLVQTWYLGARFCTCPSSSQG